MAYLALAGGDRLIPPSTSHNSPRELWLVLGGFWSSVAQRSHLRLRVEFFVPHSTESATFRYCRGFHRRRTSPPCPPQPTRHQHSLPADHLGSCGGVRSRGLLTRSPFPGELRNRDFAAGGRRASHSSQRLRRTRPRAPVAARKRWPLELTVRQRRRGQRRPKRPSQIFWGGAAAPGGLRLPPGTPGSWKWPKNKNTTINQ